MVQAVDATTQPTGQPQLHELVATVSAPTLCLSEADGQIRRRGADGLYVNDVRVLSEFVVRIGGAEPTALGHDLAGGTRGHFSAAAFNVGRSGADPRIFVERDRTLHGAGMTEVLAVRSYAPEEVRLELELCASCDLAAMGDVKSGLFPPNVAARATPQGLRWQVDEGADVVLSAVPPPTAVHAPNGTLSWVFDLARLSETTLTVSVVLEDHTAATSVVQEPPPGAARLEAPLVVADDVRLVRFLEQSVADLHALRLTLTERPDDVFLAAGAPWFFTLFGRDSIWAARMLLPLGTELAAGTLRTLASLQGKRSDPRTGEQPGKILHEVRRERTDHRLWHGEQGDRLSLPPVYYGTVDATPLWVCLLHDAWRWGMPASEVEELLTPMTACLRWIVQYGCAQDGFVSYVDESGTGLTNQGWKDSHDGIQFRDGRLAKAPLALCEVQGYAYEAMVAGATLLESFGRQGAEEYRDFASSLANAFRKAFWVEDADGRFPAVAIDREGAAVDSLTSNIGHLLGTGILDAEESELVARRLQSRALDCGHGLRTLASDSVGFNPLSYHCGSVWCHDTAVAVLGLSRTGTPTARRAALSLIEGILAAAEGFEYRMPELFGGHGRSHGEDPLPYPASCRPQAWSAAASVAILSALVGIQPDAPAGTLRLAPLGTRLRSVSGLHVAGEQLTLRLSEGAFALAGGAGHLRVVS